MTFEEWQARYCSKLVTITRSGEETREEQMSNLVCTCEIFPYQVCLVHFERGSLSEAAKKAILALTTDQLALDRHDAERLSVSTFPGFPKDSGGNSALTRLEAEVECNKHKPSTVQVTDSSLIHEDLRHILRALKGESLCGTAENATTSTNEAYTASPASPSGSLMSEPEWNSLTPDTQKKIEKWFNLATQYLQGILDEPARDAELKAQTAAMLEKADKITEQVGLSCFTEGSKAGWSACDDAGHQIRALIPTDYAAALDERDKKIHYEGSCWMLDSIRASLQGYPDHGGDIEVMKEVDRIVREAVRTDRENLCSWLAGDPNWPEGKIVAENILTMTAEENALLAAHRAAAGAPEEKKS